MDLCKRIQSLRIKNNLTQKELSEKIGVSVVSIGKWEAGVIKPSTEAIISLAKAFHVTTDNLLGVVISKEADTLLLTKREKTLLSTYRVLDMYGKNAVDAICKVEMQRIDASERSTTTTQRKTIHLRQSPTRYIPRYSTPSAAGMSVPLDGDEFEMILVDDTVPYDADFAVGIQGNSMEPYIHDGDTVYVKRTDELSVGDVGIFCVDGAMYCKQYYVDDEKNLMLLSANTQLKHTNVYVNADSNTDVRCYGKVLLNHKINLPDYIYD